MHHSWRRSAAVWFKFRRFGLRSGGENGEWCVVLLYQGQGLSSAVIGSKKIDIAVVVERQKINPMRCRKKSVSFYFNV